MPIGEVNVPPIVGELAGDDPQRLGVAAHAYLSLWRIYACGENSDLEKEFEGWVSKPEHFWLEQQSGVVGLTPLARMRKAIEAEKQRMLFKGLNPCSDFNLN